MSESLDEAIAVFTRGFDALLALDLHALSRDEILRLGDVAQSSQHRLDAFDHQFLACLHERNVAGDLGAPNTKALLAGRYRLAPAEAGRRLRAAQELGPRRSFAGEELAPEFAHVAAAIGEGAISAEHASVITRCITALPDPIRDEHGDAAEKTLTDHARTMDPAQLANLARRLVAVLDPDGVEPAEREKQRRRDFTVRPNTDGTGSVSGYLTPECLAMLQAALDPLSKPCHTELERDPRTAGQRRHDGLQELCRRMLADGGLPDTGGVSTTVLLTMTIDDLERRTGYATTGHGGTISVPDALRMAADADLIPVVFANTGGVLCYGRTKRLAPAAQRRVLAARDRGCSFPGCNRPPSWCQTHHVPGFQHGGQTNIDTMTLVCEFHHMNYERLGWDCQISDGVPWWIPPKWIDPDQKPLRNKAHDP
jgi:hypothetical protein